MAGGGSSSKPRLERIEPNRAREVELREEQLSAPDSSTNPEGKANQRRLWGLRGDGVGGEGEGDSRTTHGQARATASGGLQDYAG